MIYDVHGDPLGTASGNVLYGKKYVACGDSFTAGDATGYTDAAGNTGTNSDFYDQKLKAWKTYPWWIAKRNDMTLVNEAVSGSVFTNITGRLSPFSVERYKAVPKDADYITLMFGLNECEPDTAQGFDPTAIVGTKTDTTNATVWGAYNIVFEYLMKNIPYAKLGVILADGWMSAAYRTTVKEICAYWGVPVLDLNDEQHPLLLTAHSAGRADASPTAKQLRNDAFQLALYNGHPGLRAHEYRSTIIENWMRGL
ncbi:MAG TPA: hypothetical protein DCZ68_09930 [Faecalibacterium sp.]|nr:hypothetical protein [Faecalibacterium sp.]